MIVDLGVRDGIEDKMERLREICAKNPEGAAQIDKALKKNIRSIGDVHSYWVENPDLRTMYLTNKYSEDRVKKMAREGIRAVHNAWDYISKLPLGENQQFIDILSGDVLKATNALVKQRKAQSGTYRVETLLETGDVTLHIEGYVPPSPRDIPAQVETILEETRRLYDIDKLVGSIYAHYSIAKTQPFEDGNKRVSRLIQDKLLDDAGYPPAIIYSGESIEYRNLFCDAVKEDVDLADKIQQGKENASVIWRAPAKKRFFTHIATKISVALDEILNDLNP
jgi:Fic family protein